MDAVPGVGMGRQVPTTFRPFFIGECVLRQDRTGICMHIPIQDDLEHVLKQATALDTGISEEADQVGAPATDSWPSQVGSRIKSFDVEWISKARFDRVNQESPPSLKAIETQLKQGTMETGIPRRQFR
jgi:hypothetical protein